MDKRDYYPHPPETIEEEAAAKAREADESVTLAELFGTMLKDTKLFCHRM